MAAKLEALQRALKEDEVVLMVVCRRGVFMTALAEEPNWFGGMVFDSVAEDKSLLAALSELDEDLRE